MGSPLNLSAHFLSAHIQRQTKLKGIDMKKFIPIFVCVILFSACQQSKQGIVKDLLEAENSFEKEKVNQLLSDSFMFYGPETLNKDEYLSRVDSLKSIECQSTILKIQVLDSIVKTEEQERSIIDSLLEVTPAIIRHKTYRFVDDKLLSITVDSTLHFEEYYKSLNEKVIPFTFYVNDQYDIEDGKELYANINRDIEAALPRISDSYMTTPKFHFNTAAAYAFAARFNLMIHNYDKAIEYASKVLKTAKMRDYSQYMNLGAEDIKNAYIKSSENANLLIISAYSTNGRALQGSSYYKRFNHNQDMTLRETFWAKGPWGASTTNNTLILALRLFGSDQAINFPKVREFWEVTDKINNTGYAHIVFPAFSAEETLLVRAEAYAMKKDYANAIADMNTWITSHCLPSHGTGKRPTLTEESINTFMDEVHYAEVTPTANSQRTIKKVLHPQGFKVASGTQENIIQLLLQMRRLETWGEGQRFIDLKRYGIEFTHFVDGEDPIIFHAADKRGAIQLPEDVIKAGLEANPR